MFNYDQHTSCFFYRTVSFLYVLVWYLFLCFNLKPSCHVPFTHVFTVMHISFKVLTLIAQTNVITSKLQSIVINLCINGIWEWALIFLLFKMMLYSIYLYVSCSPRVLTSVWQPQSVSFCNYYDKDKKWQPSPPLKRKM